VVHRTASTMGPRASCVDASGAALSASLCTQPSPTARRATSAPPIARVRHVASASARFFHQGREVPLWTSSASKTAWTPLAASQRNVPAASGAIVAPCHAATRWTCLSISSLASEGTDASNDGATRAWDVATRAASHPATAARGTSERKSQKLISAARPSVRALATPDSIVLTMGGPASPAAPRRRTRRCCVWAMNATHSQWCPHAAAVHPPCRSSRVMPRARQSLGAGTTHTNRHERRLLAKYARSLACADEELRYFIGAHDVSPATARSLGSRDRGSRSTVTQRVESGGFRRR
jgi:hypothetical protein